MPVQLNRPNRKLAIVDIILVANAFIWYFIAFNILRDLLVQINATSYETIIIIGVNTGAIALAGLIGSFFADKLKDRQNFLFVWMLSGIFLSILPLGLDISNLSHIAVISVIFGSYFGVGMPATMGEHSISSKIEQRAKIGGFMFLFIGITSSIAMLVVFESIIASCLILVLVRLVGLGVIYPLRKSWEKNTDETKKIKYTTILLNKSFILYFIPWVMFTLINYMTVPIQRSIFVSELDYNFLMAIEYVITALFAVISGFIADKFGRKRLSIIGFIMLGISYAFIGLFSNSNLYLTGIIYVLTDGIAWGIFYVLFIFTIWGDLAHGKNADKLYFLGAFPYVSSFFMQLLFQPYLVEISKEMIFSFASVFLFLAILPLIYAPETLPEKIMKDRDLKSYIEKAKKKAAKDAEKASKKEVQQKPQIDDKKADKSDEDKNYEEAKKLAEKYY